MPLIETLGIMAIITALVFAIVIIGGLSPFAVVSVCVAVSVWLLWETVTM